MPIVHAALYRVAYYDKEISDILTVSVCATSVADACKHFPGATAVQRTGDVSISDEVCALVLQVSEQAKHEDNPGL